MAKRNALAQEHCWGDSWHLQKRREIYDWLMEKTERILSAMHQFGQDVRESAWRIAVESWLRSRGFIRVHINQKCHPILLPFLVHE
jgi:hypothetical protein